MTTTSEDATSVRADETSGTGAEPPSARQVAGRRWRSSRYVLFTVLALVLVVLILAALRPTERPDDLDPESPSQGGSRALAQILGQRGVQVRVSRNPLDAVATAAGTPNTTLVVVRPERLTPRSVALISNIAADVVVVNPGQRVLDRLVSGVRVATTTLEKRADPKCELPAATQAGRVDFGASKVYEAPSSAVKCYPEENLPRLVRLQSAGGHTLTLLGSGRPLANAYLGDEGNAALAMNLIGATPSVVWLIPDLPGTGDNQPQSGEPGDPGGPLGPDGPSGPDGPGGPGTGSEDQGISDLVPFGVKLAALQLAVALALVAGWRARRLGPVVAERLPIAVRSAETVEGHSRLYRAQHARDRAADALRAGARERLVPLLGLPRRTAQDPASAEEIVAALASRTQWDAASIGAALYGHPPVDDAELVRLTDFLDDLERQVRQS